MNTLKELNLKLRGTMNLDEIKEFIKLAKKEGVSELEYEADDKKISVSFNNGNSSPILTHSAPAQANSNQLSTVPIAEDIFHHIKSPFVGTFYRSSSPGDSAFVKVGDKIKKGQTLCILEAMKIMNEIESDVDGEIVEICIENESLVEFGQTLFKIRA